MLYSSLEGKVEMSFSSAKEITAKATAKQSTGVAFGMAVAMLQLLAIVSLMTVSQRK